ncbi:MAG: metallophosphoesterase [Eubacteriales bacterium]|jgi:UDP-2,3-diacylglucosamine pyrophosphatase LpxH
MYFALKRITKSIESASEILFDDRSRIVIMSDCHRGDGDGRGDNFEKNQTIYYAAINHYYQEGFTYIELGDGEELWEIAEMREIQEMYDHIYDLLAKFYNEGRLVMLYGNHDIVKRDPIYLKENYELYFPGIHVYESVKLRHRDTDDIIVLIHGHQADFLNSSLWRLARFLVRYLWRRLERLGIKDLTSAAKNYKVRMKVERTLTRWAGRENLILVAGHTHRPVFPLKEEEYYFNDGSCVHPNGITAIEIFRGSIALVKWSVKIRQDGTLYVGRDVLEGPDKLENFFERLRVRKKDKIHS